MKRLLLSAVLALSCIALITGCHKTTLQPGGAYAPTNSLGQATSAPDIAFYTADAAYEVAHLAVRAVLQFELNNRQYLWGLSPKIKQTLDGVRPDIIAAEREYDVARQAYLANPTPAGLTTLQTVLAKTQQLAVTAQAVTSNLAQKGN